MLNHLPSKTVSFKWLFRLFRLCYGATGLKSSKALLKLFNAKTAELTRLCLCVTLFVQSHKRNIFWMNNNVWFLFSVMWFQVYTSGWNNTSDQCFSLSVWACSTSFLQLYIVMSLWSAILVTVYFCSGLESFVKAFLLVNLVISSLLCHLS